MYPNAWYLAKVAAQSHGGRHSPDPHFRDDPCYPIDDDPQQGSVERDEDAPTMVFDVQWTGYPGIASRLRDPVCDDAASGNLGAGMGGAEHGGFVSADGEPGAGQVERGAVVME